MATWMEEQIGKAKQVHAGINRLSADLKSSPIILSRPKGRIKHKFKFKPQNEADLKRQADLIQRFGRGDKDILFGMDMAIDYSDHKDLLTLGFPVYASEDLTKNYWMNEFGLQRAWLNCPHHDLLIEMFEKNLMPHSMSGSPDEPMPLNTAFRYAVERGHRIPKSFFEQKETSYGEREAYYAARMLFPALGRRNGLGYDPITSLSGNFAVPLPKYPKGIPYFVDQLWTVVEPGPAIRFIVIEIDGEQHLDPTQKIKDQYRDSVLADLGYEVFRVAGWWCRVDGWRVIAELLYQAGITRAIKEILPASDFRSIDEYICSYCSEPMVRFDDNWIKQMPDSYRFVHMACHEEQFPDLY